MLKLKGIAVEGKSKKFYEIEDSINDYFMVFKPHLRSITSNREENIAGTDEARLVANTKIMSYLTDRGIRTHIRNITNDIEMANNMPGIVVKKGKTIPIEFICRYYAAGSIVRLYPSIIKEGMKFKTPLYKYDLKQDIKVAGVDDPPLFENYITGLEIMRASDFEKAKNMLEKIGRYMSELLDKAGMTLIDMKMEFGFDIFGDLMLIDEISQDCIRANDKKTNEPMTKDAFRNMKSDEEVLKKYIEFNDRIIQAIG